MTSDFIIPTFANYEQSGYGKPVVLIHGMASSLRGWDDLVPELVGEGYQTFALDLLGHGDSPKPDLRSYQIDWLFEHFSNWMDSLRLNEPVSIIGHSLGGYIALEYVRRFSSWVQNLILVNPLYSRQQLSPLLRRSYSSRNLRGWIADRTPQWMYRIVVDVTSRAMGNTAVTIHSLPEHVRAQTALDYTRTAPGVYNIPNTMNDLTDHLASITMPTLVIWGDHDATLKPSSFSRLVEKMPNAESKVLKNAAHVPHRSSAVEFNEIVRSFLNRQS
jgi:pimeloyl-ACP methyl ester carboxylesterase